MLMPFITVRLRVHGMHRWKQAPISVVYLRNTHRHLFGVTVQVAVGHSDRAVEFHTLQRQVLRLIDEIYEKVGDDYMFCDDSCETIATHLFESLAQGNSALGIQPVTVLSVEVDEDGENGGGVCRQTT